MYTIAIIALTLAFVALIARNKERSYVRVDTNAIWEDVKAASKAATDKLPSSKEEEKEETKRVLVPMPHEYNK